MALSTIPRPAPTRGAECSKIAASAPSPAAGASVPARGAGVYPYWADMAEFNEVMQTVSDASMFIDAVKAAGYNITSISGTVLVPINQVGPAQEPAPRPPARVRRRSRPIRCRKPRRTGTGRDGL